MEPLTVAAVIPVYNRPTVVLEALACVAAQQRAPDRLLVVDDGSHDDTPQRVAEWIEQAQLPYPAELVRQPNRGAAVARNTGAAHARDCDLLAFLDSDDLWPEDYLAHMAAALAQDPQAVACTCDKLNVDAISEQSEHIDTRWVTRDTTARMIVKGPPGMSNSLFRARPFRAMGGFDASIRTGQDFHLMLRMSLRGRWLHVPGPVVTYRHRYTVKRGEEPPLSHFYADRRRIRATTMTRFIFEQGGREAVPEDLWRRALGGLWFKAGRQLTQAHRREEGRYCFEMATRIRPGHPRARLQAWVTGAAARLEPLRALPQTSRRRIEIGPCWIDPQVAKAQGLSVEAAAGLVEQLARLAPSATRTLKQDPRSHVHQCEIDGRCWIAKYYTASRLETRVKHRVRRSAAWREWQAAHRLNRAGLEANLPLALTDQPRGGEQLLVFPYAPGVSLDRFLAQSAGPASDPQRIALAEAIGRQIGRLLLAGLVNRDHKASNLIIQPPAQEEAHAGDAPPPVIIDPGGLRIRGNDKAACRMLALLRQTAQASGAVRPREEARCLRAILKVDPTLGLGQRRRFQAVARAVLELD